MACPKCGCKVCYQYDDGDDCGMADDRMQRCAACGEVFDLDDHADEEDEDALPASVSVLHPAPEPHHPDCCTGCTGGLVWMTGPCQKECAKTPEFQERCERDAEASRLRFRTQVGANVLRAILPAAGVASTSTSAAGTRNSKQENDRE